MAESKYYGIYQGFVTSNQDTENRGRIKVICPTVLGGDTESAWCDPVVPVAYDNGGDFCIPAVNEAVWVLFIEGDANRPVWVGSWWSKDKTPLGTSYSNIDDIRIISYADCTITMKNDTIDINVGNGTYDIRIQNGKVAVDGNLTVNGNLTVGGKISAGGSISGSSLSVSGNVNANYVYANNISSDSE